LNKPNAAFPKDFHELSTRQKKLTFSGRVFCADSEYLLNIANGPILAYKSTKKTIFLLIKIPKKWKNSAQNTLTTRIFWGYKTH
jgi:hypothetical protein